jgi:hypothetical protein
VVELRGRFRHALHDHADGSLAMLAPVPTIESHLPLRAGPSGPAPGAPTTMGRASGEISGRLAPRAGRTAWIATTAVAAVLLVAVIVWVAARSDLEPAPPGAASDVDTAITSPADGGAPDARLAYTEISVRDPPAGLSLQVDSIPVEGSRLRVPKDGSTHVVRVAAPGYRSQQIEVDDTSDTIELELVRAKRTRAPLKRRRPQKAPPPLAP